MPGAASAIVMIWPGQFVSTPVVPELYTPPLGVWILKYTSKPAHSTDGGLPAAVTGAAVGMARAAVVNEATTSQERRLPRLDRFRVKDVCMSGTPRVRRRNSPELMTVGRSACPHDLGSDRPVGLVAGVLPGVQYSRIARSPPDRFRRPRSKIDSVVVSQRTGGTRVVPAARGIRGAQ